MPGLRDQTKEFILGLTDAELAEYVSAGTVLYEPEAVEFARHEFLNRNIDARQVADEVVERAKDRAEAAIAASELRLNIPLKILAFFGGVFAVTMLPVLPLIAIWHGYEQRGESRRATEMSSYFMFGLATIIGLFLVTMMVVKYF